MTKEEKEFIIDCIAKERNKRREEADQYSDVAEFYQWAYELMEKVNKL